MRKPAKIAGLAAALALAAAPGAAPAAPSPPVAAPAPSPLNAQKFLSTVMTAGGVQVSYLWKRTEGSGSRYVVTAYAYDQPLSGGAPGAPCTSRIETAAYTVSVSWDRVADASHFWDDAKEPGFRLMNGVAIANKSDAAGVLIIPGSLEMEQRIIRAIQVLRDACGATAPSYGF